MNTASLVDPVGPASTSTPAAPTAGAGGAPATVLCVDDEPNVLSALKRCLRLDGIRVLTADSGALALDLLAQEEVDLVISDMRMPGMDGAQLLELVHQRWPSTVRLLLTGHAEMDSAIAAINRGRIFRYLSKPWDDTELRAAVGQGLAMRALERESQRLAALTQAQNTELTAAKALLEQRVLERTASLSEAHEQLKGRYLTSIKVFANLIDLRGGRLAGHGRRVAETAHKLALGMGCSDADAQMIFVAGMLHDIGLIGLPDALLDKPVARYSGDELNQYVQHAVIGEQALMPLDDMRDVAALIRGHHERFDGQGFPDRLSGAAIPLGARILAVADSFDTLQNGTLAGAKVTAKEARTLMRGNRGTRFDPEVLDVFLQQTDSASPAVASVGAAAAAGVPMSSAQVESGMVLARDLISTTGVLMLAAGHVLTASLIERIQAFERREGGAITFSIRPRSE